MQDLTLSIRNFILTSLISEQQKRQDISIEQKCMNTLNQAIEQFKAHNISFDENEVIDEIEQAFGIREDNIVIDEGYSPWLDDLKTKIDWNHRDIYFQYLRDHKKWPVSTIYGSIDDSTDIILDHMGNPKSGVEFLKRGLVIGDVQSGKTANYIGLINKAFDVGYQLIIVLAGMQNDLRNQTQERIDREVLGYETSINNPLQNGKRIGVGILPNTVIDIESLTSRGSTGDYRKSNGVQIFNNNSAKKVAVVKKNTSVLQNLYDDLSSEINLVNGKFNVPVLIIDDEVDQASINTNRDPEVDPTRINMHIRNLLSLCRYVSYVGYTATPYANVMIRSDSNDLFPKDFIICLPKPIGYCGVDDFFGTKDKPSNVLVEAIDDFGIFEPTKLYQSLPENDFEEDRARFVVKADTIIEQLPPSLKKAIHDYIVASAIKRVRCKGPTHNGMIINIAQFISVSNSLELLVNDYMEELANDFKFNHSNALKKYKDIFDQRFKPVSSQFGKEDDWQEVQHEIKNVLELNHVVLLTGESKNNIDYSQKNQSQIIAIGGNKLSRGITIEGLLVSYYLRNPRAYDTAFQMGRWFGYKKDYLDLCRVYAQQRSIIDFISMMDATNELKQEIAEMNERKLSPKEFGLKVKTSSTMLPTAYNKIGGGTFAQLDCSGSKKETTSFAKEYIKDNFELADQFITKLKSDDDVEFELADNFIPVFYHCKASDIKDFIRNYHEPLERGSKMQRCLVYIEQMNQVNELTDWTVVVSTLKKNKTTSTTLGGFTIHNSHRSTLDQQGLAPRIISSPSDDSLMIRDENKRKLYRSGIKVSDPIFDEVFTKDRGLLIINCMDLGPNDGNKEVVLNSSVIGITIRFPNTDYQPSTYLMNDVY